MTTSGTPAGRGDVAGQLLKSFVERIERLNEEKAALGEDIRGVFSEAKAAGFDVKTLRHVIRLRGEDPSERAEHQALLDLYLNALEMLPDEEEAPPAPPVDLAASRRRRRRSEPDEPLLS